MKLLSEECPLCFLNKNKIDVFWTGIQSFNYMNDFKAQKIIKKGVTPRGERLSLS